MLETTVGKILVNEILPPDLRTDDPIDKKKIRQILLQIAEKYPEKYADISSKLLNLGAELAYLSGGPAVRFEHFRPSPLGYKYRSQLETQIKNILADSSLDEESKKKKIIAITQEYDSILLNKIIDELKETGNPFYDYLKSGIRGNQFQIRRIFSGDMLYVDHRGRPIPFPVLKSYSEGLDAAEYWAANYGARKGWVDTNLGTAKAGYLSKQLANAAHQLIIIADDAPNPWILPRGLPVSTTDPNNIGAFLAVDTDKYPRNTVLTQEILNDLKAKGYNEILIRSALVSLAPGPGLLAKDVGLMEGGRLPALGESIGVIASQSIGEPITQMTLSSKHTGGVKGMKYADVDVLNRILQVPNIFLGGATHSTQTGVVEAIEPAAVGGYHVIINKVPHYVGIDVPITVKIGDFVEAGDTISEGIPVPSKVVKYKGLGEGRRFLTNMLYDWFKKSGFNIVRRNFEIIVSSLLDFVKLTEPFEGYLPGDIVRYNWLERQWEPRKGTKIVPVDHAIGKYIEIPVLHYSIGTPVLPSVVKTLKAFNVDRIAVHDEPPPFEPVVIPAERILNFEPDWLIRFLGGTIGQMRSIIRAVEEGHKSNIYGTSFVPSLVLGIPFGKTWPAKVIQKYQRMQT
jgi:hypothetical protein